MGPELLTAPNAKRAHCCFVGIHSVHGGSGQERSTCIFVHCSIMAMGFDVIRSCRVFLKTVVRFRCFSGFGAQSLRGVVRVEGVQLETVVVRRRFQASTIGADRCELIRAFAVLFINRVTGFSSRSS
jgi:hypothetical protein